MKLYKLTHKAWLQYGLNTRDNRRITFALAQRKISRNIELATVAAQDDKYIDYQYGTLFIRVVRGKDLVIDVHNEYFYPASKVDRARYHELSVEYGVQGK